MQVYQGTTHTLNPLGRTPPPHIAERANTQNPLRTPGSTINSLPNESNYSHTVFQDQPKPDPTSV